MARNVLDEAHIHSAIRQKIQDSHADIVHEVKAAIAANDVVVVGMTQNPFPKKAREMLDSAGIPYKYLGYGSYLRRCRGRTTLKMWTGWRMLAMAFVKGALVGGTRDSQGLIVGGQLKQCC